MKLLFLGNSFSDDTIQYVYEIAKSLKIKKMEVYCLYIGGCTLQMHYDNLLENKKAYEFRYYENNCWNTKYNVSIQDVLASYKFDYINLQQSSPNTGKIETYDVLKDLIKQLKKYHKGQFSFLLTWPYETNADHPNFIDYDNNRDYMYKQITNTVKKVIVGNNDIVKIIPSGTAIYLTKDTSIKAYRDGYHLSFDYGRYISSLCFIDTFYEINWKKVYRLENISIKEFNEIKRIVTKSIKAQFVD